MKLLLLCLLLLSCLPVLVAQSPVSIPAIPHPLTWDNAPISFEAADRRISIVAGPKTDMFRDPNVTYNTDNAPKLLFHTSEDFVLSASIQHGFLSKWDGGALVLMADSLHWVKFCYEKDYTGAKRVVTVVTKGISDDANSRTFRRKTAHFKVAKAGNVITLYCSADGREWFLVRHFQMESPQGLDVGFLAQSPTGERCEVVFDNIHYEAKTIKDPYLGE